MSVVSTFEGLDDVQAYFKASPKRTAQAARLAINTTLSRKGMKLVQDEMYDQVAFPKNYLKGDRLMVSKFARETDLEGVILGRKRATSLARFAAPGTPIGSRRGGGVEVTVSRGVKTFIRGAWLIKLKRGASLTEDNFNVGLAIRLGENERVVGKFSSHNSWLIRNQVALLYGPSVNQVFNDVAEEQGPKVLDLVAQEFRRQFDRIGG